MRYIAWILLVANIAFFTWNILLPPAPRPVASHAVPVAPGIDALVLLSERDSPVAAEPQPVNDRGETPPGDDIEALSGTEADRAPAPRLCRTVGPFLDRQDATLVSTMLIKQGYVLNVRDGDVREPAGYWVYLPAMAAQEARRIVADLDTNGMKDYFIGNQNHISLGIFSTRDKAQARQKIVKDLGYAAMLAPRYRMRDVYWLDVEEQDRPLLGSETWRELQAQHPDIRAQRVSCE